MFNICRWSTLTALPPTNWTCWRQSARWRWNKNSELSVDKIPKTDFLWSLYLVPVKKVVSEYSAKKVTIWEMPSSLPPPPSDRISGSAAIRLWTISKAPSPIYFRTCTCGPKTQSLALLGLFLTFLAPFLAHLVQNHQKIALGAWQTTNWLNFFGRLQKGLCHRLPPSRFPCCVLLALSWNTNENPSTDKLSRAINYC